MNGVPIRSCNQSAGPAAAAASTAYCMRSAALRFEAVWLSADGEAAEQSCCTPISAGRTRKVLTSPRWIGLIYAHRIYLLRSQLVHTAATVIAPSRLPRSPHRDGHPTVHTDTVHHCTAYNCIQHTTHIQSNILQCSITLRHVDVPTCSRLT